MMAGVLDPPSSPTRAAALDLRAGRRREAIAGLADAQRRDPGDPGITHALLLACYHTLRDGRLPGEEAAPLAGHAIASWVALLHQDRFWTGWLDERLRRYGVAHPDPAAERQALLTGLTARIEDLGAAAGDPAGFEALLRRELAAAGQLATVGGFPGPGHAAERLVCGPLLIQALGCAEAFGAFVARLPAGDGRFVQRAFSRLGLAEALLDLDRPGEAWEALAGLACPQCRASRNDGGSPAVCAASCPRFDAENPGYAGWPDKARRLERDALELGLRIQLALGHAAMTAAEPEAEAAAASFRAALCRASALGRREETEERIVLAVLGRVKALAGKDSLTPAIALLEAVREACGETAAGPEPAPAPREQLTGQLAELLARRGTQAGNEWRWEDAVADLRRAVALNPYAAVPLVSLSFALQSRARQLRKTAPGEAIELALEAVRHLQARLADCAGEPEVREALPEAREGARSLLLQRAGELAAASGFDQSLQVLEQGLAALAGDPVLGSHHRETVRRYARFLEERGQPERAVTVLRRLH